MLQRCTNKNSTAYFLYGGRGIKILNNWKKFINFKNDMYQSYLDHVNKFGENNTTLDRINVDDNYCVNNCRWATWKQQNNNKQINKLKLII
jgi:predicted RND superfamily exporter protein